MTWTEQEMALRVAFVERRAIRKHERKLLMWAAALLLTGLAGKYIGWFVEMWAGM